MTQALIDMLAIYFENGNYQYMEAIARSMLATMPNDGVAMQFLGLTLYLKGLPEESYKWFRRYAEQAGEDDAQAAPTTCELASHASYVAATRPGSGLAPAWQRISRIFENLGLARHAFHARQAARNAAGRGPVRVEECPA